jgi:hypothetical protein
MAYYAFIDDSNIVTDVIVGKDENDLVDGISSWEDHYSQIFGKRCKRTSYNTFANSHKNNGTPYRYNFAGVGFSFYESIGSDGAFVPPKPFNSWTLNLETCQWDAPVAYPTNGNIYTWNEENMAWEAINEEGI